MGDQKWSTDQTRREKEQSEAFKSNDFDDKGARIGFSKKKNLQTRIVLWSNGTRQNNPKEKAKQIRRNNECLIDLLISPIMWPSVCSKVRTSIYKK